MEQKQGLQNFCLNIKPVMEKIRDKKKVEKYELENILQFYLEVVDYLSK